MGKRGPKPQNVERNAEIARRVAAGETLQAIGDSYGLTRERVRQIANRAGVTVRSQKIEAEKRFKIFSELAKEGLTRHEIAERSGYPYDTVCDVIRRFGIETAPFVLKKDTHGTVPCYQNGCKCAPCTKANSDRHKKWMESQSEDRIPHGTLSGYTNWRCRCPECSLQGSIANKKGRERRKGKTPPKHGRSGYVNYGCHCTTCVLGYRQYQNARQERKVRKAQEEAS